MNRIILVTLTLIASLAAQAEVSFCGLYEDMKEVTSEIEKATENGSAEDMYLLGCKYYWGSGVNKNVSQALEWFAKGAICLEDDDYSDYSMQYILKICRDDNKNGELNRQLSSMTEVYNQYASVEDDNFSGDVEPMKLYYGLAVCYIYGIGVSKNLAKAKECLVECEDGSVRYRCWAAEIYENGDLGYKDYKKALNLYEIHYGGAYPLTQAAKFYIEGKGVSKNPTKAIDLLNEAIEMEDDEDTASEAKFLLGELYLKGNGVEQSNTKAFNLFKQAAEDTVDPSPDAMVSLAMCYRFGKGTAKNLNTANEWERKAEVAGSDEARTRNKERRMMRK